MKRISALIALLLLAFASARADQAPDPEPAPARILSYYFFSRYQTSDGLSGNSVSCIVQDKDGFIWVGTNGGVCRYDGSNFYRMGDVQSRIAMRGVVEALFVDNDGLLWFSTSFGRGFYDPDTGEVTVIDIGDRSAVCGIVQDNGNNIWFCSEDLYKYSKSTGAVTKYPSNGYRFISIVSDTAGQFWCTCTDGRFLRYDSLIDKFIVEPYSGLELLAPASGNRILASSSKGDVLLIDPHTGSSETIMNSASDPDGQSVTCLLERAPGEFWIGTRSGIEIYYETVGRVRNIVHSDSEQLSISSNFITSLSSDREGNVWAGTDYSGLNLWRNSRSSFFLFYPINSDNTMHGRIVRAVTVSGSNVWVGTEEGELNRFSLDDNRFQRYVVPGIKNSYQNILEVNGELWLATDGSGVLRYDPLTSQVLHQYKFSGNRFFDLLQTSSGDVLASSEDGVYRYEAASDSFIKVPDSGTVAVRVMREDSKGRIWLGTSGTGIILLDQSLAHTGNVGHLSRITSFFEDSSQRMWVTTEGGGLDTYDIETLTLKRMTQADGLPSDIACSVVEDNDGLIWLSTINGLYMVDPSDYHISSPCFSGTQLESLIYTFGAVCKTSSDIVFMGTTQGLLCFSPSQMKTNNQDEAVYISSVLALAGNRFAELVSPGHSAADGDWIKASHKDVSSLSFNYSCLDYSNILAPQFRYTLSSRNGEISAVTRDQGVILSNVGYGRLVFTVSLVGSTNPESTKTVRIFVRPPFIKSLVAKILLVLILLATLALTSLLVTRSRKAKQRRQIEELEQAKQKEMYESKNAFFTNITHEIRTPLSLIKMPLDRIIKSGKYSEKDLLAIQANTDRLLDLTNQLLDIRKLEHEEEKLEFTRQNIGDIVRRTCGRFGTVAEDQGVTLDVSVPKDDIEGMCAHDSVAKIVSNLITNALKYGKDKIDVTLEAVDGKAVLRVDSNGERIPASEREKIFDKFVHGGKGTGLGLPLSRTLAEQHDGRLYLDSSRTDVNSFVLELPLEHPESISMTPSSSGPSELEQSYDDSRKDILIVEDNQDFRLYLADALSSEFNVFTAANGKAALEKLASRKVDLIVSDIMMPVMDGCELCNIVKSTVEYSHIPIILLTAAVGMETRIETLEVGADGYIEKPFPIELLLANIANLFKNRDIAYHQFANSPLSHFSGVTTNKMDEDVMSRLNAILHERMSESTLGIDDLSSALHMSNSTLYRKVKANTGMNVSDYIRLSRLKCAAELLATGKYRINEVADMVGFSSSSYFSANFQKQFNISPSAFVKSLEIKANQ